MLVMTLGRIASTRLLTDPVTNWGEARIAAVSIGGTPRAISERMSFRFRTVLAYAGDDGSATHVTDAALRAVGEGGRVILYPLDDASPFSSPTPTEWSAEGEQEEHESRPEPEALELLGQAGLAQELRRARESGANVHVRLAREPGLEKMVEVAREEGADAVLLPAGHQDPGIVDRLLGEKPQDEVAEAAPIPVLFVAPDGSLSEGADAS